MSERAYGRLLDKCEKLEAEVERLTEAKVHASTAYMMATNRNQRYEAEIERLLSENDKLCKSVIFWRDKAAEIERLRAERDEFRAMTREPDKSDCCSGCPMRMGTSADVMGKGCLRAEVERLKAENAELRKSLNTWIAIHGPAVAEP